MLDKLYTLAVLIALAVSFVIIALGKWNVLAWVERNKPVWTGGLCLFCWGFWLSVLGTIGYGAYFGYTGELAALPFLAAPLVRLIVSK